MIADPTLSVPALPALTPPTARDILHADLERAAAYKRAARASSTHRAYATDWAIYAAWCASRGLSPMPAHPEQVAAFVGVEADAGRRPSTIARRVAAIGYYHRAANHSAPTSHPEAGGLRETMAGIRAEKRAAPVRKAAADASALRHMLAEVTGDSLRAHRDRAVLAIGMAAALRRSELVALTLGDVALVEAGLEIRIASSKTDRAGKGAVIAVPEGSRIRPKALLLNWMAAVAAVEADSAPSPAAPLFRRLTRGDALMSAPMSDRAVARLVKACASAAGYDPAAFAAHSLRAGFLTEAASQGATIFKMQEVSRHRTVQILSDYVRAADRFRDHAGDRFL